MRGEYDAIRELRNRVELFKERKDYDELENVLMNPSNEKSLFNESGEYSKRVSEQLVREGPERDRSHSNIFNFESQ